MATPSSIPCRSPETGSLAGYSLWGCEESDTTERVTHTDTSVRARSRDGQITGNTDKAGFGPQI